MLLKILAGLLALLLVKWAQRVNFLPSFRGGILAKLRFGANFLAFAFGLYWIIVILFGLIIMALFFWMITENNYSASSETFDPVKWHAELAVNGDRCIRGLMTQDVIDNKLPLGLARADVHDLLGKPNQVEPLTDEYYLGFCSGLRIDMDGLVIEYDGQEKVQKAYQIQH